MQISSISLMMRILHFTCDVIIVRFTGVSIYRVSTECLKISTEYLQSIYRVSGDIYRASTECLKYL